MGNGTKQLSSEAVAVLGSMEVDGNLATITAGQLDRKLYVEVNAALEAIGGKWNRRSKAHIFEGDPRDALDQVVLTGGFTDAKREFDFFETPPEVAISVIELAQIEPGMVVLEPSAGKGALARPAKARGADVVCVEIQPKLAEALRAEGFRVPQGGDFLAFEAPAPGKGNYDRVVMNPPFSRQQDITHVRHAVSFVRPGGILVAIMSAGMKFRENRKTDAFRCWLPRWFADYNIHDLPEKAFRSSGTDVNAVVLVGVKR